MEAARNDTLDRVSLGDHLEPEVLDQAVLDIVNTVAAVDRVTVTATVACHPPAQAVKSCGGGVVSNTEVLLVTRRCC